MTTRIQPTSSQSTTGQSTTGQSTTGQPATRQSATRQSATRQSATRQPATRLRITARGRRALAALVASPVLVLAGLGALHATTATAGQEATDVAFETVVVQQGETLWEIAAAIEPDGDIREVIADIERLNGLDGAIVPGQELAIPLEYTD